MVFQFLYGNHILRHWNFTLESNRSTSHLLIFLVSCVSLETIFLTKIHFPKGPIVFLKTDGTRLNFIKSMLNILHEHIYIFVNDSMSHFQVCKKPTKKSNFFFVIVKCQHFIIANNKSNLSSTYLIFRLYVTQIIY